VRNIECWHRLAMFVARNTVLLVQLLWRSLIQDKNSCLDPCTVHDIVRMISLLFGPCGLVWLIRKNKSRYFWQAKSAEMFVLKVLFFFKKIFKKQYFKAKFVNPREHGRQSDRLMLMFVSSIYWNRRERSE
jgi:hypothetical protein